VAGVSEAGPGRVRGLVSGRVQGVGFRFFVVRQAQRLGLAGWVRNLPDGRVEFEAAGEPSVLAALVEAVRRGPPQADITGVEVAPASTTDELPRPFDVR
jgi:acylphosphatase